MTSFSPILSSSAMSLPLTDDGALSATTGDAQQTQTLSESVALRASRQRCATPGRGGVGTSPASLHEATQAAERAYKSSLGVGNNRQTVERLRRAWIWAKARECAGVSG